MEKNRRRVRREYKVSLFFQSYVISKYYRNPESNIHRSSATKRRLSKSWTPDCVEYSVCMGMYVKADIECKANLTVGRKIVWWAAFVDDHHR